MKTIKLTAAQALVKYLMSCSVRVQNEEVPFVSGAFAIFGHGNVAGLGEALQQVKEDFPTYRSHNEQAMGHTAIAYAKANGRSQIMMCTSSIGPGATNMVTACALANVNRLPVLFVPGDIFSTRSPDPVLQQIENFSDGEVSANDCFKPVSRYFDRIHRPEHLLTALPRAISVLTDPALCGPVTLAFPQDVQAMACEYPESFFAKKVIVPRKINFDPAEMERAIRLIRESKKVLAIAGGGVHYSGACDALKDFAEKCEIPVAETQAGKGCLTWDNPQNMGSVGVTGGPAANELAAEADLVIGIGTRLQDFTTGSWSIFKNPNVRFLQINVQSYDTTKQNSAPLVCDAQIALTHLQTALDAWSSEESWKQQAQSKRENWMAEIDRITSPKNPDFPGDSEVIGAVQRASKPEDVVLCAAGSMPGELHKLWKTGKVGGYHAEYGFSCMGYEIAGGIGAKMARPQREVIVMVGDGSYLMMNSEISSSVLLGKKLIIIVTDNRGFGCINRLQKACGGLPYNNLFEDCLAPGSPHPEISFADHARSLGANAESVKNLSDLETAMERARASEKTYLIEIKTDPGPSTEEGGSWWEVGIPEVSVRNEVVQAREKLVASKSGQLK